MDDLRFTLIPGIVAVVTGIILLAIFAYMNTESRNISFAVAALAGAIVMLFLNLLIDLQGSQAETMIPTEYTIDARTRRIRQWIYPPSLGDRWITETKASAEAFQINPEMFKRENGEKLTQNMIIFSILSYFIFEQHDWKTKKDSVVYSNRIVTQM